MARTKWVLAAAMAAGAFLSGCASSGEQGIAEMIDAHCRAPGIARHGPAVPFAHSGGNSDPALADGAIDTARGEAGALDPAPVLYFGGANTEEDLALADGPATTAPGEAAAAESGQPLHWRSRRGPAYPGEPWRTVGRDIKELPFTLWDDTKATFTNRTSLALFLAAGAAGAAICGSGLDDTVEDCFDYDNSSGGSRLNTTWDSVGGFFGSPAVHFPLAGLMYAGSLACNNVKGYETSKALINALAINGMTTMALKGVFRTESPNGDPDGWPSGHTSSSFCLATVLHKAYGPKVGVPLYAFATYVAYERVDARNHDFSDVVSGALIGIAIGHAVMQNHQPRVFGFDVVPVASPDTGSVGLGLARQW